MMLQNQIGQNIKSRRLALGLSQEKLAYEAEVDRTYIPKVENGEVNMTIKSLEKLLKALNVSVRDFFIEL